jgi:hypothetical protein
MPPRTLTAKADRAGVQLRSIADGHGTGFVVALADFAIHRVGSDEPGSDTRLRGEPLRLRAAAMRMGHHN